MKTYKKLFLALIGSICFSNILGMVTENLHESPKSPKLTSVESSTLPQSWKTRQHSEFEAAVEEQEERKELSFQSPLELSAFLKTLGKGNYSKKRLQIRMHIPDDSEEQEQVEFKFNLAPTFVQRIFLDRDSDEQRNVFLENTPTIQYCDEECNLGKKIQLSLIDQQANQGIIIREKDAGTLFVEIPVYLDARKEGLSLFTFDIKQLTPGTSYQISLGYELSPEGIPTKAICSLEPIQGQESDVSVRDTMDLDPGNYVI